MSVSGWQVRGGEGVGGQEIALVRRRCSMTMDDWVKRPIGREVSRRPERSTAIWKTIIANPPSFSFGVLLRLK